MRLFHGKNKQQQSVRYFSLKPWQQIGGGENKKGAERAFCVGC
jgi:hypothetical protein